jgi:hypothetical protein
MPAAQAVTHCGGRMRGAGSAFCRALARQEKFARQIGRPGGTDLLMALLSSPHLAGNRPNPAWVHPKNVPEDEIRCEIAGSLQTSNFEAGD